MTTPVVTILDAEIKVITNRLAGYRKGADKAAAKKGCRVSEADRLCEWAEHRIAELKSARDRVQEMIDAEDDLQRKIRANYAALTGRGNPNKAADCANTGMELHEARYRKDVAHGRCKGYG